MEPILLGAAIGGGTSALRGGNPLQGALLGGLTGGVGSAASGALSGMLGSSAAAAAPALTSPGVAAGTAAAEGAASGLGAVASPINMGVEMTRSALSPLAAAPQGLPAQGIDALMNMSGIDSLMNPAEFASAQAAMNPAAQAAATQQAMNPMAAQAAAPVAAQPSGLSFLGQESAGFNAPNRFAQQMQQPPRGLMDIWKNLSPEKKLLYGGGGALGLMALMGQKGKVPGAAPYTGPLSRFNYDPMQYRPTFAQGGIASLGGYSDGGRLLKGPGDGMSDHIPATIANKQPARLADGEFVIPADVVSHLGNGSTDAGAKQLYAMMDRVRAARTGNSKQGKEINAEKFMPKQKKRKVKRFESGGVSAGGDGPAGAEGIGINANAGDGGEANAAAADAGMATAAAAAPAADGMEGMMSMADVSAALSAAGLDGGGFYGGGNDFAGQYGQGAAAKANEAPKNEYAPQSQPSVNTNIYRPIYTDYARSSTPAVSDYGTNMQSPFGEFMNPFAQASAQRGIASLYNGPAFDNYGLAGLNR